jgi:hypothetical protein
MNKLIIYTVSAKPNDKIGKTPIAKSLDDHYFDFKANNTESLSKVYNKAIEHYSQKDYTYLVLVHDDVYINCKDFYQRVEKYLNTYTVFGLAGNTEATITEPTLWHLMGGRHELVGCVAHGTPEKYYYTSFGPLPKRALMIDGVMIGINLKKLPKQVRFDENCPARFHFYDLIFSMECALNKVPVGVVDVPIIHESPGLREYTDEWKKGQEYFLTKYNKFKGKTLRL